MLTDEDTLDRATPFELRSLDTGQRLRFATLAAAFRDQLIRYNETGEMWQMWRRTLSGEWVKHPA